MTMTQTTSRPKLNVTLDDDYVATVELTNGEYNFFDMEMLIGLAETFEALDDNAGCRAILLSANGKAFCAGADFQGGKNGANPVGLRSSDKGSGLSGHLYDQAVRLFATKKPIVAAIHGAAIGGGLGLALVADMRVGCPQTRMAANFTQLGIHPGFGLSFTLPRIVGQQSAYDMFYTGRRVAGEEAFAMGLLDQFVDHFVAVHPLQLVWLVVGALFGVGPVGQRLPVPLVLHFRGKVLLDDFADGHFGLAFGLFLGVGDRHVEIHVLEIARLERAIELATGKGREGFDSVIRIEEGVDKLVDLPSDQFQDHLS